jgi:glycine hydroxymethyltransferase
MALAGGGHLTHGAPVSISGMHYDAVQYGVDPETGLLDYDAIEKLAVEARPKLLICGLSAYPRVLDFERFAAIGKKAGALVLADIAHISGLVATGVHPSPVPHVDLVTTTTHKSLRGPRGGMVMCRKEYAEAIDKAVFPGLQGGPHNHTTAAIAVALKEAATPAFKDYSRAVVDNARVFGEALSGYGFKLVTGGTDNHLLLVDVTTRGVTGSQMSKSMDAAGIVCNYNLVPGDSRPAMRPSGIRLGTPAVTSRGFGAPEMKQIAAWMDRIATLRADDNVERDARRDAYREIASQVRTLCDRFPAPGLAPVA